MKLHYALNSVTNVDESGQIATIEIMGARSLTNLTTPNSCTPFKDASLFVIKGFEDLMPVHELYADDSWEEGWGILTWLPVDKDGNILDDPLENHPFEYQGSEEDIQEETKDLILRDAYFTIGYVEIQLHSKPGVNFDIKALEAKLSGRVVWGLSDDDDDALMIINDDGNLVKVGSEMMESLGIESIIVPW